MWRHPEFDMDVTREVFQRPLRFIAEKMNGVEEGMI